MSGETTGVQGDRGLLGRIADTAAAQNLGAHRMAYPAVKGAGRLDLYENGFTAVLDGSTVRVGRYDSAQVSQNVVRVHRNGVHTHTTHEYRVTDVNGAELRLTEAIRGPEEWGPALVEAVAVRQAAGAVDAVRAGRRVEFGSWWLSAAELGTGRKVIALQQLRGFRVDQGTVTVEAGEDFRVTRRVGEIPNFLVFRYLLRQLRPDLPESAGKIFARRLTVRGFNRAVALAAVIAFGIACVSNWPVHKAELCGKLSDLQAAKSELTDQLKALRDAADNYRGEQQDAVRSDSDKLDKFTGSGRHWLKDSDLDGATPAIRTVCQANSFARGH
ncbi:DUF6585 family protein [Nocardia sp. NPDC051030]|uniref:DUF6585 family protein n=1 Tax=Nocardia sp. NPDC051030 TaxID=3155162 RepID=UPI0034171914